MISFIWSSYCDTMTSQRRKIWLSFVPVNACHLVAAEPSPGSILLCCQLDSQKQSSVDALFKYTIFSFKKMHMEMSSVQILTSCSHSNILTCFKSLWPSEATWRQGSGSTLAQVMAWCRQATMLTYHQLGPLTFTWGQFHKRYLRHQSLK